MKALLVTFDKYPDYDAGAIRIHMFGKMLADIGYDVTVISMGPYSGFRENIEDDGFSHISYRGKNENKIFKAFYYFCFPFRLKRHIFNNEYDVIIHTQIGVNNLKILQRYGLKRNIPIIFDCVEWFSESQFSNGKKSRAYKLNNYYNEKLIKHPSSVISISRYLESHFKDKGIMTIRIPVVLDTSVSFDKSHHDDSVISLLYAGSPGRKDYIANVINAIDLLTPDELRRINFTIVGCTYDQIVHECGVKQEVLNRIRRSLNIRGRLPRSEVIHEYSKADFSVLIRQSGERYAKAGFPTKFVESLNCSTPVICNISSDLADYLVDGENSIVLDSISPVKIAYKLKEILSIDMDSLKSMKDSAKRTAIEYFDYHKYENALAKFINDGL